MVNDKIDSFLEYSESYKLDQVETEVSELFKQFQSFRANNADMLTQRNSAIEEKYVAYAASLQLQGSWRQDPSSQGLLEETSAVFSTTAGVILQLDQERFARTIFRATRGNAFTEFHYIPEPLRDATTGMDVMKSVFVVYYQGGRDSAMSGKISRICTSFSAGIYAWPRSETEALEQIQQADQVMEDKRSALMAYEKFLSDESNYLFKCLREGGNSLIEEWRFFCAKEKNVYATLNKFEGDVTLRADCWFPAEEEEEIKNILIASSTSALEKPHVSAMLLLTAASSSSYHTSSPPPTYIKENEVIQSFQLIVNTYGVPRYKEANPALFAIVTFPFLFGVMFGDVGHGLMLLMVGLWAVFQSRNFAAAGKPHPGLVKELHRHRYLLLAMGFFAVYAGLIYSEFFAIGLNLFGSRWSCSSSTSESSSSSETSVECTPNYDVSNTAAFGGGRGPYPFGIDPAWDVANNQLLFVNSLKMKASVLFGVAQMLLGIALKFANSIFFKNITDLVFECLPQLAFMLALFAYMDFLIMYKWVHVGSAPGLIDTMISMGLSGGKSVKNELFSNQANIQSILFQIALCSVPLMLVPKPLILWAQHKFSISSGSGGGIFGSRRVHNGERHHLLGEEEGSLQVLVADHEKKVEEFEFGEVAIHQAIETIEFVLGTVSHTASYLRLWALSLAHQQLSLVFLHKTLYAAMTSEFPMFLNAIPIYIGFAVFIGVTTAILLGMDVMECFLHTLRLHWVEFQSKFFKADGLLFKPFSHRASLLSAGLSSD